LGTRPPPITEYKPVALLVEPPPIEEYCPIFLNILNNIFKYFK